MTILTIFLITSLNIIVQRSAQPKSMKEGLLSTRQDVVTEVPVLGFNHGFTEIFRALWAASEPELEPMSEPESECFYGRRSYFSQEKSSLFPKIPMCTDMYWYGMIVYYIM